MPAMLEARPVSTVVRVRDTRHGLETLLLKRNEALMFADGSAPGAHHRAVLRGACWRYQYDDGDPVYPPLIPPGQA